MSVYDFTASSNLRSIDTAPSYRNREPAAHVERHVHLTETQAQLIASLLHMAQSRTLAEAEYLAAKSVLLGSRSRHPSNPRPSA